MYHISQKYWRDSFTPRPPPPGFGIICQDKQSLLISSNNYVMGFYYSQLIWWFSILMWDRIKALQLRRRDVLISNLQKFTIQKCKCNFMAAIENSTQICSSMAAAIEKGRNRRGNSHSSSTAAIFYCGGRRRPHQSEFCSNRSAFIRCLLMYRFDLFVNYFVFVNSNVQS